jgi:cellulose synthase/poly-beta-1,6-N-acetylglucosamine synthase-like glycosyltransferase
MIYVYIGYPLLITAFARIYDKKLKKEPIYPHVSIIITAYNEERHIQKKIENTLSLNYPKELMEIIIGSDGSRDRTEEIVSRFRDRGVKLISFPENRGKTMTQNDCVRVSRHSIIVFMDASSLCEEDALSRLVEPFADLRVGCVAGKVVFVQSHDNLTTESQGLYWKYEQLLKRAEGRMGSLVGVDGPLYAIRKELYVPLQPDIISDLITPLVVIRDGHAVVHEPRAVTYEEATTRPEDELRTRKRIVTRGLLGLFRHPELLNPFKRPLLAFQILSHKILRWFAGLYFVFMAVASLLLIRHPFFLLACAGIALFLVLAWQGLRTREHPRKLFAVPYYFILVNWAALLGALDYIRGKRVVSWKPVRQ